MKFKIGNIEPKLLSASLLRTINTGTDEFNCVIEWRPGVDKKFDELIKPRSLADITVSIGNERLFTGYKYLIEPNLTTGGNNIRLGCYSKTYPLIMSNPKTQKEYLNSSLREISKEYCDIFGILTKTKNVDAEADEPFDNVKIGAQSKIFDFLQDLARQRGILTSSDEYGNLLYLRPDTKQKSIGSIIEGAGSNIPRTDKYNATFDDTKIYQNYLAVNDSPFSFLLNEPEGVSKDTRIRIPSFKTITMNSLIEGAAQNAVDFARNQTLIQGMSMPVEVNGWYAKKDELWREGKLMSIVSPTLFVPKGYTFLIVSVQFNLDSRGEWTVLNLASPSLFTNDIIEEPW